MGVLGACFLNDSSVNNNEFKLAFFNYDAGVHAIYSGID